MILRPKIPWMETAAKLIIKKKKKGKKKTTVDLQNERAIQY